MISENYRHIFTPANIVTTIRIALIPVFVVVFLAPWPSWVPDLSMQSTLEAIKPWIAAAVFALLAFTDSVDGYLARSRNEVTTLGKFLDPLADKILVTAALLALVELNEVPAWVVLVIISREFLVSGLRMVVSAEGHVIAASIWGKVKTVVQIIAIICFIVKANPELVVEMGSYYGWLYWGSWFVMTIALLLTLYSMADYFYKASKVLALPFEKTSAAHLPGDEDSLAGSVIAQAKAKGFTIGTAESCTGGLAAKCLTDISGASEVFMGSVISYSNEVKARVIGVGKEVLDAHGAVSEEVAKEMAQGAIKTLGVDYAVSITGIAGPKGGSKEKPVGTVWVGVAVANEEGDAKLASAECYHFGGNREQIRAEAAKAALETLRKKLEALPS